MSKYAMASWMDDVFSHPWKMLRLFTIAILFWLATVFSMPNDTFERSASYDLMQELASENTWGVILALLGVSYTIAMFRNWHYVMIALGLISFVALATISICFLISGGFFTAGAGLYGAMAMQSLLTSMNGIFYKREL
jgi:hypothetical protein